MAVLHSAFQQPLLVPNAPHLDIAYHPIRPVACIVQHVMVRPTQLRELHRQAVPVSSPPSSDTRAQPQVWHSLRTVSVPSAAMANAKSFFPEEHPNYIGTYWGQARSAVNGHCSS